MKIHHEAEHTASSCRSEFAGRPFSVANAEEIGLTRARLRTAHQHGLLVDLGPSLYIDAQAISAASNEKRHLIRVQAAMLRYPDAVASHGSAALVAGLPYPTLTLNPGDVPVQLLRVGGHEGLRGGIFQRRSREPVDYEEDSAVRRTPLVRSLVDIAIDSSLPDALVTLDAALRGESLGRPSPNLTNEVRRSLGNLSRARRLRLALVNDVLTRPMPASKARKALLAIQSADPRAENPFESWSRGQFIEAGLPAPEVGYEIAIDGNIFWVDMAWPEYGVVGEADGLGKYGPELDSTRSALRREKERQDLLVRSGRDVVRWTFDEIVSQPKSVVARVQRALRQNR